MLCPACLTSVAAWCSRGVVFAALAKPPQSERQDQPSGHRRLSLDEMWVKLCERIRRMPVRAIMLPVKVGRAGLSNNTRMNENIADAPLPPALGRRGPPRGACELSKGAAHRSIA